MCRLMPSSSPLWGTSPRGPWRPKSSPELRSLQRGENVQIVVIYFNRFFVNRKGENGNWSRGRRVWWKRLLLYWWICWWVTHMWQGSLGTAGAGWRRARRVTMRQCVVKCARLSRGSRAPKEAPSICPQCVCVYGAGGLGGEAKVNVNRFNQAKDKCGDSAPKWSRGGGGRTENCVWCGWWWGTLIISEICLSFNWKTWMNTCPSLNTCVCEGIHGCP